MVEMSDSYGYQTKEDSQRQILQFSFSLTRNLEGKGHKGKRNWERFAKDERKGKEGDGWERQLQLNG